MANLLKNRKTIFVCIILVLLVFLVYILSIVDTSNTDYSRDEGISYLKNYGVNEYIPVYVEEADVVIKYFNNYKNIMIRDVELAYNLLNKEYREEKYGNLENFKKYVNNLIRVTTYSMEVDVYKTIYSNGNKYFDVYDKDGNHYIFKEKSIMDYEVYLDNYTVEIN